MDAMQGDAVSRRMLFLTNRPPLFVATALVGNNTANYLTSLAIVLLTKSLLGSGLWMELLASIAFTPIVFVYGELMPKNLFYQAPNFLLRLASRPVLFFAVLFAPLSALLWSLGRVLEKLFGQSPEKIRLALARKDLGDFFIEGQQAGLLHPTQLHLAQNFFLVATQPVSQWTVPVSRTPRVKLNATRAEVLKLARKWKQRGIVITDPATGKILGYVRVIDLIVNETATLDSLMKPLTEIEDQELHGEAIMRLQSSDEWMAKVVDRSGQTLGVLTADALKAPLLGESLTTIREQPAAAASASRAEA